MSRGLATVSAVEGAAILEKSSGIGSYYKTANESAHVTVQLRVGCLMNKCNC